MTSNLILTVPMLHVTDMKTAIPFYCKRLGFMKVSEYKLHENSADPAYVVIQRDETRLHLSSFPGDGKPGAVAVIFVNDVDALHREFSKLGIDVGDGPVNQTWGNREMYISDPDGNQLRYTQSL